MIGIIIISNAELRKCTLKGIWKWKTNNSTPKYDIFLLNFPEVNLCIIMCISHGIIGIFSYKTSSEYIDIFFLKDRHQINCDGERDLNLRCILVGHSLGRIGILVTNSDLICINEFSWWYRELYEIDQLICSKLATAVGPLMNMLTWLILGLRPANERRRYFVSWLWNIEVGRYEIDIVL